MTQKVNEYPSWIVARSSEIVIKYSLLNDTHMSATLHRIISQDNHQLTT